MLSIFEIVEIESIELCENPGGIAYDLEVEEDHSYNVEGVVVHNSICSTRLQTGHGMPTFASILECSKTDRDAALIADGGIRTAGDIVKAIGAGADAVMLGSMLAGTDESPGEVIAVEGRSVKVYRGMASKEAQFAWRGHYASLEGVSSTVDLKGPVKDVLFELTQNIRSGFSYSGARSIAKFQAKVKFVRQTSLAAGEAKTHIDKS